MAEKLVGIDIGRGNIKIVCGSCKKGMFTMHGYRILQTPENAVLETGELDLDVFFEDDMAHNISDAVKSIGCKGKKCNISISGKNVIIRERKIPLATEKELEEIVRLEAQGFIQGAVQDFSIDYRIIDRIEEEGNQFLKVLIAAVPLDVINSYVELVEKSEIKLESIDVHSSCITDYAKYYILQQEYNTLVVDIGARSTRFVMYDGEDYFAELDIDVGGDDATISVSNFLNSSIEELEEKKMREGRIVSSENMDISNEEDVYFNLSIKKTYEKIAQEITRVMDYYRTRRFNSSINNIVFIGGGSNITGLADYIGQITGVRTSLATIPPGMEDFFADIRREKDFLMLVPAIGAILRGK